MKSAVVIFCSIIILCSIITPGASKGPTISSITGKILNFVDEDGSNSRNEAIVEN